MGILNLPEPIDPARPGAIAGWRVTVEEWEALEADPLQSWSLYTMEPITVPSGEPSRLDALRFCEACLETGFHSVIFQMFADFDFIAITGIMRFVNRDAPREQTPPDPNRERDFDDPIEGEDEEDDSDSTSSHFLFSTSALPSSTARAFGFYR